MKYSGYERTGQRWLVYASRKEKPRVSTPKDWETATFAMWDDFRVHLPPDAVAIDSSPVCQGIAIHKDELLRPPHPDKDGAEIVAAAFGALWAILRPAFQMPKERADDGEDHR